VGQQLLVDHRHAAENVACRTLDAGDDDCLVGIRMGGLGVARRRRDLVGTGTGTGAGPGRFIGICRRSGRLLGRGGMNGKDRRGGHGAQIRTVH